MRAIIIYLPLIYGDLKELNIITTNLRLAHSWTREPKTSRVESVSPTLYRVNNVNFSTAGSACLKIVIIVSSTFQSETESISKLVNSLKA